MSEPGEPAEAVDPADSQTAVVLGLVAVPPDHPAVVVHGLADELTVLLAQRVGGAVGWDVRTGWADVVPHRHGSSATLLDDVAERRADGGWDVAVCLTDLPLQVRGAPLVAHASPRRRVGVVSLPALGLLQRRSVRAVVTALVAALAAGCEGVSDRTADERAAQLVRGVRMIEGTPDPADGDVRFVASRITGTLRLLAGMVLANRPGRALSGLSKLLVGAFGTAAFALATNTIWQLGDALDPLRLTLIMLGSLAALVAWLIYSHDLWERPALGTPPELARLFNWGTVLTLGLAAGVSYVVLLIGVITIAALLIDPSVLGQSLGHPVGPADYLTLGWIISSMATVGGAIGSGLEDEDDVRATAYGYHPEPGPDRPSEGSPAE